MLKKKHTQQISLCLVSPVSFLFAALLFKDLLLRILRLSGTFSQAACTQELRKSAYRLQCLGLALVKALGEVLSMFVYQNPSKS